MYQEFRIGVAIERLGCAGNNLDRLTFFINLRDALSTVPETGSDSPHRISAILSFIHQYSRLILALINSFSALSR